jgi:uncharacterized oxidoreductase
MKATNHTVLITGGGTGIGLALAQKFHQAGNRIILVGRREAPLTEAAKTMTGAEICVADITKAEDRARLVARFPQVNILVNNAGVRYPAAFADATEDDLKQELAINLLGPILLAQAFLPVLKAKSEAAIINVSSAAAIAPREVAAMYSASKAALHSYTKSMRYELEKTSVRVFEVLPPVVETPMTAFQNSNKGMLTPAQLADEFWRAFLKDHFEILIGKAKLLHLIRRLSPAWADSLARNIRNVD